MIHIGIDFDNTIICYDSVFYRVALEQNLIPRELNPNKTAIRDFFRAQGKEDVWTELQGFVYGSRIDLAAPFEGVGEFFSRAQNLPCKLSIVSHKTKHPYLGPKYDLHEAAKNWLLKQSFFTSQISCFFELTLAEKLQRIEKEACDFFLDDLPELLDEPLFPTKTGKILFDPNDRHPGRPHWKKITAWNQLASILPF